MLSNGTPRQAETLPFETPLTRWQKIRLVIKVVELRLRFVALMAITGLVFAYWDTIWNRYEKWMRPAAAHASPRRRRRVLLPDAPPRRAETSRQLPDLRHDAGQAQEGRKAGLARGVTARVVLAPSRVEQAGIKTVDGRLCASMTRS